MELIPKRDALLDDETTRQQNNERLRVQFAQMANQVGSWCKQRIARLTDIGMNAQGTLENQLNELKTLNEEIDGFKPHVLQLDELNKVGIGYILSGCRKKWIFFPAVDLRKCVRFIAYLRFYVIYGNQKAPCFQERTL